VLPGAGAPPASFTGEEGWRDGMRGARHFSASSAALRGGAALSQHHHILSCLSPAAISRCAITATDRTHCIAGAYISACRLAALLHLSPFLRCTRAAANALPMPSVFTVYRSLLGAADAAA